jgi:hypothetical protein
MSISVSKESLQIAKRNSFKFRRRLCCFVPDWNTTALKRSLHSILHAECSACRFQCRNNPCKSQNAFFQTSTKTLLFRSRLRYYGHINALPTPFYTAHSLHVDFSVETIPANRKTQSFKFLEISVISIRIEILRRSYALSTLLYTPNVAHVHFSVERIPANRKTHSFKFLRNHCHFRSVMRYYSVHTLFPLYSTRLTCCI